MSRRIERAHDGHELSGFDRFLGWVSCPACLRLRFSPVHLYWRVTGWCDGKNGW